jgi:hypothetical protein
MGSGLLTLPETQCGEVVLPFCRVCFSSQPPASQSWLLLYVQQQHCGVCRQALQHASAEVALAESAVAEIVGVVEKHTLSCRSPERQVDGSPAPRGAPQAPSVVVDSRTLIAEVAIRACRHLDLPRCAPKLHACRPCKLRTGLCVHGSSARRRAGPRACTPGPRTGRESMVIQTSRLALGAINLTKPI